jgi:uncharacterized protein
MAGLRLPIRLVPRGGIDRVEGVVDGELRCRVAAPAVDGAANEAIIRLIARELGIPRSAIELLAGAKSRRKVLALPAVAQQAVAARWPELVD